MAKKVHKPEKQDVNIENEVGNQAGENQVTENVQEGAVENEVKDAGKKEPTAEEKLAELQDKYLRLSAEFDNYRKRTMREKGDLLKSANEDLLTRILPVSDDFERALVSIDQATDMDALKTGVHLIFDKFFNFLKQQGIKEIEARNLDFNTDLHEAVTKIPAPDESLKGKVVDVIEKGYYLNDKVIRFAKVVIGE
ncbi:MAG: nucleotide exchange factor GrpE [Bacteroidota bacterium]